MRKISKYIIFCLIFFILASCGDSGKKKTGTTSTSGTITLMCDNSFENIMQQEIDVFEYQYPKAHILARYIPQKDAVDSLMEGKTKAIVITRDITEAERKKLEGMRKVVKSRKIAVDALALIVNPENPIEMLSKEEIGDILTGKVSNWNELEPNNTGEIKIYFDDAKSSTVQYMQDSLMNGQPFSENVYAQGSIQKVFEAVRTRKNAVGIIGVSWITSDMQNNIATEELAQQLQGEGAESVAEFDSRVKVLKVMGNDTREAFKPYQQYIYDGSYPLFRQIYMIISAPNGTLEHGFYSFVTGFIGQKIILKTGIMPAVIQPQIVEIVDPNQ